MIGREVVRRNHVTSQPAADTANVLLSSAGRRVELLQCLRSDLEDLGIQSRVIAVDASPHSAAGHLADELIKVPAISDPAFMDVVLDVVSEHEVRLIVPTIDTELDTYARSAQRLHAQGCHVLVSGPSTVEIASDKKTTHDHLVAHGLPCPTQWPADAARALSDDLPYPVFVKPQRGSSSIGIRVANCPSELLDALREDGRVVETTAPGIEYTVDVWVDHAGNVRSVVPRRRIEVRAGEVSKGITAKHAEVEAVARSVASSLPDAYGPLTIQLFADETSIEVIEINARLGGGYPLSWAAGATSLKWGILDAVGGESLPDDFPWHPNVLMLRYDQSVFLPGGSVKA